MKERVTTVFGTSNVILVAPHSHDLDDTHTGALTLAAAKELDAHAIVNNGWKRSKTVDEIKGEANCNNIDHCVEPVVKAEFLDPIYDAIIDAKMVSAPPPIPLVLMIHGVGNSIRTKARDPKLDLIVGFGAGDKPKLTCQQWLIDLFVDTAEGLGNWTTYEGAPGGDYSARNSKNLTQAIYRAHHGSVNVLQLEFVYATRTDDASAKDTGRKLACVLESICKYSNYTRMSNMLPPHKI